MVVVLDGFQESVFVLEAKIPTDERSDYFCQRVYLDILSFLFLLLLQLPDIFAMCGRVTIDDSGGWRLRRARERGGVQQISRLRAQPICGRSFYPSRRHESDQPVPPPHEGLDLSCSL